LFLAETVRKKEKNKKLGRLGGVRPFNPSIGLFFSFLSSLKVSSEPTKKLQLADYIAPGSTIQGSAKNGNGMTRYFHVLEDNSRVKFEFSRNDLVKKDFSNVCFR